ncbi:hypothetical protein [uncultured Eubacterium sp.]|uniref:hypothetical protein n=1 Tax=uncultured Eubacterium sp. TaxID=165185 RepID=UPI003266AFD9
MRSLKKNKQKLYYAMYSEEIPVYETDEDGKIKYTEVDGEQIPIQIGIVAGYSEPVIFYANIAKSGGEAEAMEYGFDVGSYQAVLSSSDMTLPINEMSRIWHMSEPRYNADGSVDGDSADYQVLADKSSLNVKKFLLKQLPKGSG